MLISEIERLAELVHAKDYTGLKNFILESLDRGDGGIRFHAGVRADIKRVLKEGP